MQNLPPSVLTWLRMTRFVHNSDQISNENLRRHGLNIAQFEVLSHLHAFEPITQGELAAGLTVSCGGVSRMLARLEQEGLIERERQWRTKHIRLTPKGREVLETAYPEQVALQASLFDDVLTDAERRQLNTLVKKLYDHSKSVRATA